MIKCLELFTERSQFYQALSFPDKQCTIRALTLDASSLFWTLYSFDGFFSTIIKSKSSIKALRIRMALPNCADKLKSNLFSEQSYFIPPTEVVTPETLYILLSTVVAMVVDLRLDDENCIRMNTVLALDILQATLDEWKTALPESFKETIKKICEGKVTNGSPEICWRKLFCFILLHFAEVYVRLPLIFKDVENGITSISESFVLSEALQASATFASLLSACLTFNPKFDYAMPYFVRAMITSTIPLIIASKLDLSHSDALRISYLINIHREALIAFTK